ncbi:Restriction endonuclease, type II, MjaI [Caldithrix abyssi DSM 13497]|uniref:Restriction endonuclease, type II, MjaI n=2 Tax=Caldithrix abyssi DSM 13497 TaxID=880073 RepID=H1XSJ7_CALAY|nr:MjaI family restriction endonuclease [Caldithrix abyssi]EHO42545.1 Restriction endonuclease, type II, MjaI [Caldithrix abyssi DSM 13497]
MKKRIFLTSNEIQNLLGIPSTVFPKYSTQILNLANQNAQATRPKVVGQMSELIKEFSGKTLQEWEDWYLKKHPEAIPMASQKILDMVENLKDVINKIDMSLIEKWVYDLIIVKTFVGLKFQEAILKKVASILNLDYCLATPEEEAKGIDGYIGKTPISIKPSSYTNKAALRENISVSIIYYEKVKNGIKIDFSELF